MSTPKTFRDPVGTSTVHAADPGRSSGTAEHSEAIRPTATGTEGDLAALLLSAFPLVNDHPDVAGLLRHPRTLAALGPALAEHARDLDITVVCAPEARGPILGALVALELGVGMVLVRKAERNHPGADARFEVGPTWRGHNEIFQARTGDLAPSDRVLAVDDWITTGSTLQAIRSYTESVGATYVGASVLVDKADPRTIENLSVTALLPFDRIMERGLEPDTP